MYIIHRPSSRRNVRILLALYVYDITHLTCRLPIYVCYIYIYILDCCWPAVSVIQCDMAVGSQVFFDMMHSPPAKAIILGDACSHVTVPVAESAIGWNVFQVSNLDSTLRDFHIPRS